MKGLNDTFKDYKRRNSDYFINFFKSKFIEQRIETLIIYLHITPEKTTINLKIEYNKLSF